MGYIEPHVRPETQALVLGLDVLPRCARFYIAVPSSEFDLEAALTRKPQLILVDELAHTNAPGLTHAKAWQDIDRPAGGRHRRLHHAQRAALGERQRRHGSDHAVVTVRETVPDSIFERADEIELVDLAPDDLIDRLREGKVYVPEQAQRAIEHFFQKGNLIAPARAGASQGGRAGRMRRWRATAMSTTIERTWPGVRAAAGVASDRAQCRPAWCEPARRHGGRTPRRGSRSTWNRPRRPQLAAADQERLNHTIAPGLAAGWRNRHAQRGRNAAEEIVRYVRRPQRDARSLSVSRCSPAGKSYCGDR